ncbi:YihY/virulence factor BrkB family protein [Nocardiopsis sp. HNM0947]|uniref:YihY/virulence factor BrkB family protein n=1 Tax=Nocardiopsis coralli TaxID=2772213 RepID=A0ABR9PBP5_9ACTN|nr:YihY/virulence factor BrkB family protein [Nocardiopsis coralli]MBE3001239.1 YihY/virulence factor BrkB family protein [Nocardiopsis coralli]
MVGAQEGQESTPRTAGASASQPARVPAPAWRAVAARVWLEFKKGHAGLLAAGMAFRAMLALFPALLAAVSLFGIVADPDDLADQIRDWLVAVPDEVRTLIERQLTTIAATETGTLGFTFATSVLLALWNASGGMYGLMEGCNAAYDVVDSRPYPLRRGIALLLALGVGAFVCFGVGVMAGLPALLGHVGLSDDAMLAIRIGQWPLLALLTVVGLGVVYRIAPHRPGRSRRWVTPGAVIAMLLWLFGSLIFTYSVQRFGDFGATYGAIAGVIVLMLWLWLSSLIVLLGAMINAELERASPADPGIPGRVRGRGGRPRGPGRTTRRG